MGTKEEVGDRTCIVFADDCETVLPQSGSVANLKVASTTQVNTQ
ncbi:hypothetical protein ACQ4M4_17715 [Leptolyngbya sp. AN02str]